METKVLIDTNVLLDYLLVREPYFNDAKQIIQMCVNGNINGCIAAHSIPNMFFILRKEFDVSERRKILISICKIFNIEAIDGNKIISALENEKFSDFEDCLQMECANHYGAEYIITRNVADYKESIIKAVTPEEFIQG